MFALPLHMPITIFFDRFRVFKKTQPTGNVIFHDFVFVYFWSKALCQGQREGHVRVGGGKE